MLNYDLPNSNQGSSQMKPGELLQQLQLLKQLPMDIDLSEFIINTDVDILNRYYDVNRQFGDGIRDHVHGEQ